MEKEEDKGKVEERKEEGNEEEGKEEGKEEEKKREGGKGKEKEEGKGKGGNDRYWLSLGREASWKCVCVYVCARVCVSQISMRYGKRLGG